MERATEMIYAEELSTDTEIEVEAEIDGSWDLRLVMDSVVFDLGQVSGGDHHGALLLARSRASRLIDRMRRLSGVLAI
jgi:hypothetical protein